MSYALSAFVVPRRTVLRFPGCADLDLLRTVMPIAQARLADLDEQLFDADDDDAITHEQAFRELFSGNITAGSYGATYGWAFETLCDCLGHSLSNRSFSPCRLEWYDELDRYLASSNVGLRFDDLINNCPIAIPISDDWPMIGHWTHQDICDSKAMIKKLVTATSDRDMADALATVDEWFGEALKDSDNIIVGFHG